MSTYENSRKTLEKIRQEFGCQGDIIFRTAMQYVVEFGQRTFGDKEWLQSQLDKIDAKHDVAEANGKMLYVGRRIEKAFFECAAEIALVDTYHLLVYIQKELWVGHEGGLAYERAIELLHSCMNWFIDYDCCTNKEMLQKFDDLGFYDDELETLGFGWLFEEEDENND
jgi:hypothetical protein